MIGVSAIAATLVEGPIVSTPRRQLMREQVCALIAGRAANMTIEATYPLLRRVTRTIEDSNGDRK